MSGNDVVPVEVFVNKTSLINMLGDAAIPFALFMTSDTAEAKAFKFLLDSVEQIDLNCSMIQNMMIPTLTSLGVFDQAVVDRINAYIQEALA